MNQVTTAAGVCTVLGVVRLSTWKREAGERLTWLVVACVDRFGGHVLGRASALTLNGASYGVTLRRIQPTEATGQP